MTTFKISKLWAITLIRWSPLVSVLPHERWWLCRPSPVLCTVVWETFRFSYTYDILRSLVVFNFSTVKSLEQKLLSGIIFIPFRMNIFLESLRSRCKSASLGPLPIPIFPRSLYLVRSLVIKPHPLHQQQDGTPTVPTTTRSHSSMREWYTNVLPDFFLQVVLEIVCSPRSTWIHKYTTSELSVVLGKKCILAPRIPLSSQHAFLLEVT